MAGIITSWGWLGMECYLLDLENVVPFLGEQFGLELKAFLATEWNPASLGEKCRLKLAALRCGCLLPPCSYH